MQYYSLDFLYTCGYIYQAVLYKLLNLYFCAMLIELCTSLKCHCATDFREILFKATMLYVWNCHAAASFILKLFIINAMHCIGKRTRNVFLFKLFTFIQSVVTSI